MPAGSSVMLTGGFHTGSATPSSFNTVRVTTHTQCCVIYEKVCYLRQSQDLHTSTLSELQSYMHAIMRHCLLSASMAAMHAAGLQSRVRSDCQGCLLPTPVETQN